MKRLFLALATVTVLLSCSSKEDQVMQAAQTYLKSMYAGEYQTARTVAADNVLKYIDSSIALMEGMNEEEQKRLLDYMGRAQYNIDTVDEAAVKADTVLLHYTLQFPSHEATQETLKLRKEGRKWLVFAFK